MKTNEFVSKVSKHRFVISLILVLALSSTLFSIQNFSEQVLVIDVKLGLTYVTIPTGYIDEVTLKISDKYVEPSDNITRTYNNNTPTNNTNVYYYLTFTLNETSNPQKLNYTISKTFDLQGNYAGNVITSFNVKGRYKLTIDLFRYSSESSRKCASTTSYIEIY